LCFNFAELISVESEVAVVFSVDVNHIFQMSGQLLIILPELKNLRLRTVFFTLKMLSKFLKLLGRLYVQLAGVLKAGFEILDFFLLLNFFFGCQLQLGFNFCVLLDGLTQLSF